MDYEFRPCGICGSCYCRFFQYSDHTYSPTRLYPLYSTISNQVSEKSMSRVKAILVGYGKSGKLTGRDAIMVAHAIRTLYPTSEDVVAHATGTAAGTVAFRLTLDTKMGATIKFPVGTSFNTWEEYKEITKLIELAQVGK